MAVVKLSEEVDVGPGLLNKFLEAYPLLKKAYDVLTRDSEYAALVEMSNIMAVKRLLYNDHGPVHAKIVAGSALEIFERLVESGVKPTTLEHRTAENYEQALLVVLLGTMLHDVGNSVHRSNHELLGALLSRSLVSRVLTRVLGPKVDAKRRYMLRQEILHVIYSTAYDVQSLTVEAGSVKIGDGTDMSQGRARFPYRLGKNDIHAVSALAIEKVTISSEEGKPVVINVYMREKAGVFQIERVLQPKIATSGLEKYVVVRPFHNGKEFKI